MDFVGVYREIATFLRARSAPLAIVGGLALHARGVTRVTSDLDLLTQREHQDALVGFLEAEGWRTLHRSAGFSNHQHPDAARGRVDVLYVEGERNRPLFEQADSIEVLPGLTALVPRAEHLVAMKVLAMKNEPHRTLQEMADIQRLIRSCGLEPEDLRGYFARHGLEDRLEQILQTL